MTFGKLTKRLSPYLNQSIPKSEHSYQQTHCRSERSTEKLGWTNRESRQRIGKTTSRWALTFDFSCEARAELLRADPGDSCILGLTHAVPYTLVPPSQTANCSMTVLVGSTNRAVLEGFVT
jgi:hypothetical protein